jgi:Domain of unknown function (DUF4926)
MSVAMCSADLMPLFYGQFCHTEQPYRGKDFMRYGDAFSGMPQAIHILRLITPGYLEVYEPEVFEIEFSDLQGRAYALETLRSSQIMRLHHQPLVKVLWSRKNADNANAADRLP